MNNSSFKVGDRVSHATNGNGTIEDISDERQEALVDFDDKVKIGMVVVPYSHLMPGERKNAADPERVAKCKARIAEYDARAKNVRNIPEDRVQSGLIRDAWQKELDQLERKNSRSLDDIRADMARLRASDIGAQVDALPRGPETEDKRADLMRQMKENNEKFRALEAEYKEAFEAVKSRRNANEGYAASLFKNLPPKEKAELEGLGAIEDEDLTTEGLKAKLAELIEENDDSGLISALRKKLGLSNAADKQLVLEQIKQVEDLLSAKRAKLATLVAADQEGSEEAAQLVADVNIQETVLAGLRRELRNAAMGPMEAWERKIVDRTKLLREIGKEEGLATQAWDSLPHEVQIAISDALAQKEAPNFDLKNSKGVSRGEQMFNGVTNFARPVENDNGVDLGGWQQPEPTSGPKCACGHTGGLHGVTDGGAEDPHCRGQGCICRAFTADTHAPHLVNDGLAKGLSKYGKKA